MLQRSNRKEVDAKQGWSIRAYLIALAVSCTLPLATVAGIYAYHLVSESSQTARSAFEDRLRLLRSAVELQIDSVIQDLQVLARSPALPDGNLVEFRRHAAETAILLDALGIILSDRDGRTLMNTRAGRTGELTQRTDTETLARMLATEQPQISDLKVTGVGQVAFFSVEVPVRIEGQIRYSLAVGFSPKHLSDLMRAYVPADMVGSIIDRNGILVARLPFIEGQELVGQPTIREVRERLGAPEAWWIEAISRAGTPTYTSFLRSERTGWSINMALPRDAVDGPVRRIITFFIGIGLIAVVVSLYFAREVSARFLRALNGLEEHVMELGNARVIRPRPGPVAEVNRMERTLQRISENIAQVEETIERERSLLRATVETIPIGVLLVTADGQISLVNRKMLSLCAVDPLRSLGEQDRLSYRRIDGSAYPLVDLPIARALQSGEVSEGEEVLNVAADGTTRHQVLNAAPVRDGAGQIIAAVSACYDVTEERAASRRQQILLDEINHRVKNTLATVQAIARVSLSSATSLREYASSFERRLIALAGAYNLLTENSWEGADLRSIVERTLAPFGRSGKLTVSGPALILTPKLTLAMSAAIQELSANAAKYGALSAASGRLEVAWSAPQDGQVSFSWVERDGPPVTPPTRRGFGTRFIQEVLAAESGWTVRMDYRPEGLCCTMSIRTT